MIIRIVKMTFDPERVQEFEAVFDASKEKIRGFEGCLHLELLRQADQPNVYFTYSYWEAASNLEAYRHSEVFKSTWAKTKPLFVAKPEAWSLDRLVQLP